MKQFEKLLMCLLVPMALGACDAPVSDMADPAAQPKPKTSVNAGPGSRPATRNSAVALFTDVCVATAPTFADAPAVLAKKPVLQNANTGTYYHQTYDMSVKITPSGCSIVAGGNFKAGDLAALQSAAPGAQTRPMTNFDRRTYMSAVLPTGTMPNAFLASNTLNAAPNPVSFDEDMHRLLQGIHGAAF